MKQQRLLRHQALTSNAWIVYQFVDSDSIKIGRDFRKLSKFLQRSFVDKQALVKGREKLHNVGWKVTTR